ncbi:MAG: EAL domain-containing protein [Acidobacteriaceae bacterium]
MSFAEAEIRRGLDSGEFFPVFQPMVELRTGQLAGFEVLARWKPEGRETVLPGDFIPLAQKSGLIDRLTEVILL